MQRLHTCPWQVLATSSGHRSPEFGPRISEISRTVTSLIMARSATCTKLGVFCFPRTCAVIAAMLGEAEDAPSQCTCSLVKKPVGSGRESVIYSSAYALALSHALGPLAFQRRLWKRSSTPGQGDALSLVQTRMLVSIGRRRSDKGAGQQAADWKRMQVLGSRVRLMPYLQTHMRVAGTAKDVQLLACVRLRYVTDCNCLKVWCTTAKH